jgi:RNA polymerase sigma-70 factor, ECF subfamily
MVVDDDSKEVEVPINATHLRALPGRPSDSPPDSLPGRSGPPNLSTLPNLEALFREHHDRIFRTAHRITGSIVDAEDVLQTVFLKLSRRQGEFDLEPSPGSYLHRAAINVSLDLLRQRRRSASIPIDEIALNMTTGPGFSPESQSANSELRGAIRRAISKLGERSAEMFVLKYFEGYENREIAEIMGTSALVVGVLLHRARARVKKEMRDFLEGGRV